MNHDKDDILALRVENDPPIKIEVKRVQPMPRGAVMSFGTDEEYNRYLNSLQSQQAAAKQAPPLTGLGVCLQQQQQANFATPFGRTLFGGIA